jgi:hypothetical protein
MSTKPVSKKLTIEMVRHELQQDEADKEELEEMITNFHMQNKMEHLN